MEFLADKLRVKKSTLEGAGKGLFTTVDIPKGTRIVEYRGQVMTWKEASKDVDNGYIFFISNKRVINAKDNAEELGRYANDATGLTRIKGITNNAEYVIEKGKAFIDAKKDIPKGSEIFVSYSKEYWDVIRENIRADKEKAKAAAKELKKATKKKK
jgi:Proteins containing SET domain